MRYLSVVWWMVSVCFLLDSVCFAQSPVSSAAVPSKSPDKGNSFADEPYVVERLSNAVRFEADGKSQRVLSLQVRIQSESAIKEFGLLEYPYMAGFEDIQIVYVRVRKPDGSVVETPVTEAQDVDSPVSREAPMYTDQREKHIAVKSLASGDILEVRVQWTTYTPIAPGHFWFSHNFFSNGICLNEMLEVNVPRQVPLKIVVAELKPEISEEGGRRIYLFKTSHLSPRKDDEIPAWEQNPHGAPPPALQISSFASWEEVGAWYAGLQKEKTEVSPEIRAKAEALAAGKTTEREKIQAFYDFVSSGIRYIGIDLNMGRYSPHAAHEVLVNRYGDCKDKHVLFTALLRAAGIQAFPVLASTEYKLDPSAPSPGLFNHVLTAIPQGDSFLFLDTTPEVAPFGLLVSVLRDRQVLVLPLNGPARLVSTPPDPPFPSREFFHMDASIDLKGTLDGKARMEARGDSELALRLVYRATPQNRWKELTQALVARLGFGGTVSDVSVERPDDTSKPFGVSYAYHRTDYSDWGNRRITLPFSLLVLPELTAKQKASKDPLPLGSPQESIREAVLKLPPGIAAVFPPETRKTTDFADFSLVYVSNDGKLYGTLRLNIKVREIVGERRGEYAEFEKTVNEAMSRYIFLTGDMEAANPDREGLRLLGEGKTSEAVALLEKAAKEEPANPKVRMALATAYLRVPEESKALEQFHWVLDISKGAMVLNAVASAMVDSGHLLDEAQQYAGQAVAEVEKDTLGADLNSALKQDYARMMHLASAWDTLGWAKFRSGEVNRAEKYAEASWMLLQTAETGEHLVEIYERQGKTERAKRICRMALATFQLSKEKQDDARKKLLLAWKRLTGQDMPRSGDAKAQTFALSGPGPVELSELRAVKVPLTIPLKGKSLSATFAISFLNGPEGIAVEEPKFLSGSEALRATAPALRAAPYRQPFPDTAPARILRTGILHCSKYLKECTLVLTPLDSMIAEKLLSPVE